MLERCIPGCFQTLPAPKFIVLVHKNTTSVNPLKPCLKLQDTLSKQLAAREPQQDTSRTIALHQTQEEVVEMYVFPSLPRRQLRLGCPETPDAKDGGRSGRKREQQCHAGR
jgi:hypothetical protein